MLEQNVALSLKLIKENKYVLPSKIDTFEKVHKRIHNNPHPINLKLYTEQYILN